MATGVTVRYDDVDYKWSNDAYRKNQLYGFTYSRYYLMSEINNVIKDEKYTDIRITASDCLVDPNIPLRYSLQNALDNDPATSYVENTEDDLMEFDIRIGSSSTVSQLARLCLINGYAQSQQLYIANNRVKALSLWSQHPSVHHSIIIRDETLDLFNNP